MWISVNRHITNYVRLDASKMHQIKIFLVLILLMTGPAYGQQNPLKFSYLTVDDGLSHTDVKDVLQDKRGFIWIATLYGLDRFDGHVIKRFYNTTVPKNYAFKNRIRSMCLDDNGRIWLGSEDGIQYFDPKTERYINMESLHHRIGKRNYVRLIYLKSGHLATLGENRFRLYKINRGQLSDVALKYSPDVNFTDMAIDKNGLIWLSGSNGVWVLDRKLTLIRYIDPVNSPVVLNDLLKIAINRNNQILVVKGTTILLSGLMTDDYESQSVGMPYKKPKQILLSGCSVINDIIQDKNFNYWVSTDAGLYLLDTSLEIKQIITNKSFINSINTNFLNNLFIDRSECLWVCTFGGGIDYCDLNQKHFYAFQHNPENPNTLSGNHIRSILEESGKNLWIGTNSNGLNSYNFRTKKFTQFNNRDTAPRLISNEIDALEIDDDHNLWIGTDKGIQVLNSDRTAVFKPAGFEKFPTHSVASLAKDCFGNIWFGSYYNGFGFITHDQFRRYKVSYKGTGSGYYIYADKNKPEILISSINGLIRLKIDSAGNVLQSFHYGVTNGATSLSSDYIFPIRRGGKSSYWVGTIGGGLNLLKLSPDDKYGVEIFDHSFGVFNDVEAMELDNRGNVWMGGNGLERFDPVTKKLIRYDKNDGLQSNSFKVGASFKGQDGRLYFGGINGLNFFYPDSIKNNPIPARPTFTDLIVNNEKVSVGEDEKKIQVLDAALPYKNELELNYKQNNFVVSFSAMHYANSAKCQYRYKLVGFDKDWNYTSGERPSAAYTNLDYRSYELILEASNNDGLWSKQRAEMTIAVLAPWWKSDAAKAIYFIIIISVLAGIYVYQARWYRLKNELVVRGVEERKREEMHLQQEELYRQQLQFFANISHEFRTPLTLILGPLESLIAELKEKTFEHRFQIMHRNAKRLINLINELINFRKVADKAVQLGVSKVAINEFVQTLYDEFHQLADHNQIEFTIELPDQSIDAFIDHQVVEKIMFNLLNNAFKYTQAGGKVTLETFTAPDQIKPKFSPEYKYSYHPRADKYIYFRVSDTGVGISSESIGHVFDRYYRVNNNHIGSGIGLALVKSLIELHHGDIWVYSERNKGTEIFVAFPSELKGYKDTEIYNGSAESNSAQLESVDKNVERNVAVSTGAEPEDTLVKTPKSEHILIVEDNDELRAFLKEVLEKKYTIYEAVNGKEGLDLAISSNPDLIISDVMMPVMNGVDFCRRVRETFETSHIPFLFLSAKDALEAQLEGMESGADFYISKPVSIDLLTLTIANLFEQNRKLKLKYTEDYYAEASELVHSEKDREFIDKLIKVIDEHVADFNLDVDFICDKMNTSRSALYKKIKSISGQSINEFIRTIRLKKAAYILTHEDITQNELVDRIGIQSVSYFQKAFRKEFGKTPTQFLQDLNKGAV